VSIGQILKRTWNGYNKHRLADLAAMLTYYAIFALFPFAILTVTVTLLFLPGDVLHDAFQLIAVAMPGTVAAFMLEQLKRMEETAAGGFAIVAFALAVWGASRGAVALQTALNSIHEVKETRPWWKVQLVAIGVTLGVSLLILVALALLLVGPAVGHWIADKLYLGTVFDVAWTIGRWVGAALLIMLVWACLYYFLPNIERRFRWVTPGAIVGVLLWLGASRAFIFYADNYASYDKTYGTLAISIVFLTWIWLSSMTLLVGGQLDDALDELRKQTEPAGEIPRKESAYPVTPEVGRKPLPVDDHPEHPKHKERPVEDRRLTTQTNREFGLADLAKRVGDDFATLAKSHVELARTELSSGVKSTAIDAGAIVLGGIVALIGLAMLCTAAIAGAEPLIPALWLRLVLGAVLYMGLGAALIGVFVKRLRGEPLNMKRTRTEVERTAHALKESVQNG
jgi:membrane protein